MENTQIIVAVAVTVPVIVVMVIIVVLVMVVCRRHRARRISATLVTFSGNNEQSGVQFLLGDWSNDYAGPPPVSDPLQPPSSVVAVGEPIEEHPPYTLVTNQPQLFHSVSDVNSSPEPDGAYPLPLQPGDTHQPSQLSAATPTPPTSASASQ